MQVVRGTLVLLTLLVLLGIAAPAQTSSDEVIFTISVLGPVSAKDVQVRYFVTDDSGARWSSTLAQAKDDKVQISVDTVGRSAKAFKAVAYVPGCQFVTFSADDLSTSTRRADFQCVKLPTTSLRGTVAAPSGQQNLKVEAMYVIRWASKFFSVPGASISPLALAKAPVDSDGAFSMDLPDFTADPLWSSLTRNATLMFFLEDANGHRLAELKAPASLSLGGNLKIAATYPDVKFTVRQNNTASIQESKP
jgi:hypothetical protein